MRRQTTISILIAAVCSSILLYIILQPGIFNFLPYLIHKEFFESYNSNGDSTAMIEEGLFIKIFDVIISIIFFGIVYKISFWRLTKHQQE